MTLSTPGKIERTSPRTSGLRDLTDKRVRNQIVADARKDASASLVRNRRRAAVGTQNASGQTGGRGLRGAS
jgi:hypothetical protein